jgi:hypothetical protein
LRLNPVLTLPLLTFFTLAATACDARFLSFFGSNPPGSPSGTTGLPGRAPAAVAFDRAAYRVRLEVDPAIEGWDAAVLDAATVRATVLWEDGASEPIAASSSAWNWGVPSGLGLLTRPQGTVLVAGSTATGSYELRLTSVTHPTVQATATVRVSDDGAADVVIQ